MERYGDINPITSLGFLRVFFKAMIEISRDIRNGKRSETQEGDRLSFATKSGEAITLVPDGKPYLERLEFLKDTRW